MWLDIFKIWLMVIHLGWRKAGLTVLLPSKGKMCRSFLCSWLDTFLLNYCWHKSLHLSQQIDQFYSVPMTSGIGWRVKGVGVGVCGWGWEWRLCVCDVSLACTQDSRAVLFEVWCFNQLCVLSTLFCLLQLKCFVPSKTSSVNEALCWSPPQGTLLTQSWNSTVSSTVLEASLAALFDLSCYVALK